METTKEYRNHQWRRSPSLRCAGEKLSQRRERASSFLSKWIDRNSFNLDVDDDNDEGKKREDDDVNDNIVRRSSGSSIRSSSSNNSSSTRSSLSSSENSSTISSVSITVHSLEEDEEDETEDLRVSVARLAASYGAGEVYEASHDNFNRSMMSIFDPPIDECHNRSIQSLCLPNPETAELPPRRAQSAPRDRDQIPRRETRGSIDGYLPSFLADVSSCKRELENSELEEQCIHHQQRELNNQHTHQNERRQHGKRNSDATVLPTFVTTEFGTIAAQLPWLDLNGRWGTYTGYINARLQPHGRGALVYEDSSSETSVWENGTPVEFWHPSMTKAMQEVHVKNRSTSGKLDRETEHPGADPQQPSFITHTGDPDSKADERRSGSPSKSPSDPNRNDTFLPHLDIGDAGSSLDMSDRPSSRRVGKLRLHDFAFVLRSDKTAWTYAIVAHRSENSIRFVVNMEGATKVMKRGRWKSHVRMVSKKQALDCSEVSSGSRKKRSRRRTQERRNGFRNLIQLGEIGM